MKWPRSFDGTQDSEELELDTGVFSGVWRRSVLEGLGGWDVAWPANEDAELASRWRSSSPRWAAAAVARSPARALSAQSARPTL